MPTGGKSFVDPQASLKNRSPSDLKGFGFHFLVFVFLGRASSSISICEDIKHPNGNEFIFLFFNFFLFCFWKWIFNTPSKTSVTSMHVERKTSHNKIP